MARKPIHQPWHPAPWKPADAYAIKALASGTASDVQQKRALDWIIRSAGTYEPTFFVGQQDATHFAEGSRHVGLQIVKLVNMPSSVIGRMNEST